VTLAPWLERLTPVLSVVAVLALSALAIAHVTLLVILLRHAKSIKTFMQDFPTHGGQVVLSLWLTFWTGVVIVGRLALGKEFLDYTEWFIFLALLGGINAYNLRTKRTSSPEYLGAQQQPIVNAGDVGRLNVQVPQPPAGGSPLPGQKDGNEP
jgi:hypothetical protein